MAGIASCSTVLLSQVASCALPLDACCFCFGSCTGSCEVALDASRALVHMDWHWMRVASCMTIGTIGTIGTRWHDWHSLALDGNIGTRCADPPCLCSCARQVAITPFPPSCCAELHNVLREEGARGQARRSASSITQGPCNAAHGPSGKRWYNLKRAGTKRRASVQG